MSYRERDNHQRYDRESNYSRSPHQSRSPPPANKWGAAASAVERGGPSVWEEEDRMNNSEWLQSETKRVQGESVQSSRRALNRLNEATTVAEQNLNTLNLQSEQFNRMEKRLDEANANAKTVEAKVDHLKSLKGYFFLPSFGAKKAKDKEEKFKAQKESEQFTSKSAKEREKQWEERNNRVQRRTESSQHHQQNNRYYTTPDGLERDENEEEIDSNLGQISSGLSRLKSMGIAMGEEMESQDQQLRRINDRTDATRRHVDRLNNKVDNITDKGRRSHSRSTRE
ncbi:hypothetical protein HDV02_004103 [Globomyces sp. JEL0801]|nr:hypothetical protein HDV02_004103 [Globomyces sp. JEL0801]